MIVVFPVGLKYLVENAVGILDGVDTDVDGVSHHFVPTDWNPGTSAVGTPRQTVLGVEDLPNRVVPIELGH